MTKIYIEYDDHKTLDNLNETINVLNKANTHFSSPYDFSKRSSINSSLNEVKKIKNELNSVYTWLDSSIKSYHNFDKNLITKARSMSCNEVSEHISIVK